MKNLIIALTILTSCVSNPIFSQHEVKFIDKKNELSFEENKGQMKDQFWKARPDVLFYGHSEGMNFFIKNSGMSYQLSRVESWKDKDELMKELHANTPLSKEKIPNEIGTYRVDVNWLGANHNFETQKGQELDGYNNYYNVPDGVDPALFVKKYASLTLYNVWDGINLHYYGTDGLLETDYIVSPGADFKQIKIQYQGGELSTDNNGNLIIKTPFGEIHEGSLKVFQEGKQIEAHWMIQEDNIVSFDIPSYNPNIAMVIDPLTRVWGTYYGGISSDFGKSITIDGLSNSYLAGETISTTGITSGGHQNTHGGGQRDGFLVKFDSLGIRLWGTYYGGAGEDGSGLSIATDGAGHIYLTGQTDSNTGIASSGHQNTYVGGEDAFLVKFNSSGVRQWGTYYGGLDQDQFYSAAIDGAGNVYAAGYTESNTGIASGGHQNSLGGGGDAFLVKFNSSGVRQWGTYYGGPAHDVSYSTAADGVGNVYLSGTTTSVTGIASGGHQNLFGGGQFDAFLIKFDSSGLRQWGTYYGDLGADFGRSTTCDNNGNVYITGYSNSTLGISIGGHQNIFGGADDAFLVKFNGSGVRQWGTYYGGVGGEQSFSTSIDGAGSIYICGSTYGITGISSGGYQNTFGGGNYDAFLVKFNNYGVRQWGTYYGGLGDDLGLSIATDGIGNVYMVGVSGSTMGIALGGHQNAYGGGIRDAFLVKFNQSKINGYVWLDINSNCTKEGMETVMIDGVNLTIQPGNYICQTIDGIWSLDSLPIGTYTVTIDTTNLNWITTCPISQTFTVTNVHAFTDGPNFGLLSTNPCSSPEITILAPTLRRCFSNQIVYVQACNDNAATIPLDSSYVIVTLDTLLTVNSASLPFTALGNNTYQFQTGTLNPGQCVNFTLSTTVSCNATLGQTLCMNAELFPVDGCVLDSIPSGPNWDNIPSEGALGGLPQPCLGPWDQSSLSVDGWCQNDSIYFTITNTGVLGGGDMECYAPVWLTVNGVVTFTDSIMLQGGQTITYAFEGNGQTWILNASQHPLHPGNSQPNAFVERCGNAANWNPGEVNDYPQDDADPVIDIFCEEVSGSYDPNDKRGYPNGVTNMNYIQPNQQLQYVIRFQNTGTDTAFTVVIRDTLDTDLNIFTVTPGVSSHSYEFRMYGPRVLEWRFDNILLPDSTTNSVGSNGFVTFHVEQNPNLAPGTVINNDADIYFDYNDPITTNTTVHRIYEGFPNVLSLQDLVNSKESIILYPNPTSSEITITSDKFTNEHYTLYDQMGRTVGSGTLAGTSTTISLSTLSKGIYILKVEGAYESAIVVKE
jgi:uncharacterized repeat protein (TIGR01451 family)